MNRAEKLILIGRGIELLEDFDSELAGILYQLELEIKADPIHPDTDCVFKVDNKWLRFEDEDIVIVADIDRSTVIPYRDILLMIETSKNQNKIIFWNGLYYYKSTKEFILRDKVKVTIQEID